MGVAGHRPVEVLLCALEQAPMSAGDRGLRRAERSRVYMARSVTTWSLRERAVCSLPPTGPATSVRRRSIAMWMSSSSVAGRRNVLGELALDGVEAGQQRVAVLGGDDRAVGKHPRVGARLRDVLGPQASVEADRGVQAPEVGVLGLVEAGHGPVSLRRRAGPSREPPRRRGRSAQASCLLELDAARRQAPGVRRSALLAQAEVLGEPRRASRYRSFEICAWSTMPDAAAISRLLAPGCSAIPIRARIVL